MVTPAEAVALRDTLGAVPFFRALTPEELDRIITLGRLVPYAKGAVLFREGDPGEALYIVVDGSVRISKVVPGAQEEAMAFLVGGPASARWPCSMGSPAPRRPSPTRTAVSWSSSGRPSRISRSLIRSSPARSCGPSAAPCPCGCAKPPTGSWPSLPWPGRSRPGAKRRAADPARRPLQRPRLVRLAGGEGALLSSRRRGRAVRACPLAAGVVAGAFRLTPVSGLC